jgi:hypothetical protein
MNLTLDDAIDGTIFNTFAHELNADPGEGDE